MDRDKIQKWYGYQRYYLSGNKYITNGSIFITISGYYPLLSIVTHHM